MCAVFFSRSNSSLIMIQCFGHVDKNQSFKCPRSVAALALASRCVVQGSAMGTKSQPQYRGTGSPCERRSHAPQNSPFGQ